LVADIITPVILNPVMDFLKVKNLENVMWHKIKYGKFLASVINFLVVGFVLFIIVRMMNRIQHKLEHKEKQEALEKEEAIKKEIEEKGPKLSLEESLLTEIRDLLSKSKTS
jgi:large conductance mechanosensitive channel